MWQWQRLGATLAVGVGGIAIASQLAIARCDGRVTPEAARIPELLLLLLVPLFLALTVQLLRHSRPVLQQRGMRFLLAYLGGSLLLQLVLSAGAVAGVEYYNRDFLFGPVLRERRVSPDGKRVGYLYWDSFMCCTYEVFERPRGSLRLHLDATIPRDRCDASDSLGWDPTSQKFDVRAADGRPLEPEYWHFSLGPR